MTTKATGPSIKLRDAGQLAELRRIAGTLTAAEARPVPVWEVIARLIEVWRARPVGVRSSAPGTKNS